MKNRPLNFSRRPGIRNDSETGGVFRRPSFPHLIISLALLLCHPPAGRAETAAARAEIKLWQSACMENFSAFSELCYAAANPEESSGGDFLIVRNFQTRARDSGGNIFLCEYSTPPAASGNEAGLLGFSLASENGRNTQIEGGGIAGFIRRPKPWEDCQPQPRGKLFGGAAGTLTWAGSAASRPATISLEHTIDGQTVSFEDWTRLEPSGGYAIMKSFEFPAPNADSPAYFEFAAAHLLPLTNSRCYAWLERADSLTAADLAGTGIEENPELFWNTLWPLVITDNNDADRDGVTDLLDTTLSATPFPWYADAEASSNWYWAGWMDTWVHSTRATEWDYFLTLGWVYVWPDGGRDNFWMYAPPSELGWLWTCAAWYPWIYRAGDQALLFLSSGGGGRAVLYNAHTASWETVRF